MKRPTSSSSGDEGGREVLVAESPVEIAGRLSRTHPGERLRIYRQLSPEELRSVFDVLEPELQNELLGVLPEPERLDWIERMEPDDRARLLTVLSEEEVSDLLARLSPKEHELTDFLLAFPEESAGRIMSPEVLRLDSGMTVSDALRRIREQGASAESIYAMPLTDSDARLIGMIELRDLILAEGDRRLEDLADPDVPAVRPTDDQEKVARLIQSGRLHAVPVVDADRRVLGIVTIDDAINVLDREEAEDLARTGATEPLGAPYLSVSVFRMARRRVVWLSLLALAATLTVNVLSAFEATLDAVVSLALFIPLLIGVGGNAGTQSATTVIRAMAVEQVRVQEWLDVLLRESRTGLLLGALMAGAAFSAVSLFAGRDLALVVSLTLLSICTLASTVGAAMPLIARRVGIDPAVVSAPFVTTLVDATGLLVYFSIARWVLPID